MSFKTKFLYIFIIDVRFLRGVVKTNLIFWISSIIFRPLFYSGIMRVDISYVTHHVTKDMYIWYYEKLVVKSWHITNTGKFPQFTIMNYSYLKLGILLITGSEDNSKFCMFYIAPSDSNVAVPLVGKRQVAVGGTNKLSITCWNGQFNRCFIVIWQQTTFSWFEVVV